MVSASVRVNEVTTIAAAADKFRLPDAVISVEVGCSIESSSPDDRLSEGVNEPTAVQLSPGPAVAVLRSVSILCEKCLDHGSNVDEAKNYVTPNKN